MPKESVKELIEDVKNLSELMLSLAYSSVFFESKDIAKEVMILYNDMEHLEEKLYLHLFAASRGRPSERLISVIDITESAKMVANAAKNLSEGVLEGRKMHPIIKDAIRESDESIVRCIVSANSVLKSKTLGDLKIRTDVGIQILAIKRENKWIFNPKKDTHIFKNDLLIGTGPRAGCKKLDKLAKGEVKKI
jgi:uncharacterized protein with PhoU and TrkA domain